MKKKDLPKLDVFFLVSSLFAFLFIFLIIFLIFHRFFSIGYLFWVIGSFILLVMIYVHLKFLKFLLIKDVITEKEYRELILKKQEYKNKVEKKENKVPDELTESSTKKYLSLLDEGDLLNDKYYQGCIFFNSSIGFILFSFYFGVFYMSKPFWLLKNIFRIFKNYLRKEEDHYFEFGWRKVFNEEKKEYIYFIFFISRQNPIISGYGPVLRKIKK